MKVIDLEKIDINLSEKCLDLYIRDRNAYLKNQFDELKNGSGFLLISGYTELSKYYPFQFQSDMKIELMSRERAGGYYDIVMEEKKQFLMDKLQVKKYDKVWDVVNNCIDGQYDSIVMYKNLLDCCFDKKKADEVLKTYQDVWVKEKKQELNEINENIASPYFICYRFKYGGHNLVGFKDEADFIHKIDNIMNELLNTNFFDDKEKARKEFGFYMDNYQLAKVLKTESSISPEYLKQMYEKHNPDGHYFDKETLKFFGDSMKNYYVRDGGETWDLCRIRPVKGEGPNGDMVLPEGFSSSFDKKSFKVLVCESEEKKEKDKLEEISCIKHKKFTGTKEYEKFLKEYEEKLKDGSLSQSIHKDTLPRNLQAIMVNVLEDEEKGKKIIKLIREIVVDRNNPVVDVWTIDRKSPDKDSVLNFMKQFDEFSKNEKEKKNNRETFDDRMGKVINLEKKQMKKKIKNKR